jgi:hypothetical protein
VGNYVTLSTPSLMPPEVQNSSEAQAFNNIPSSISIRDLQRDCCRYHHVQASSSWIPELWPSPSSNVTGNGLCRPATSLLAEPQHPSPCVFLCCLTSAQPSFRSSSPSLASRVLLLNNIPQRAAAMKVFGLSCFLLSTSLATAFLDPRQNTTTGLGTVPQCAQICLSNSTNTQTACSDLDIKCLCSNQQYVNSLSCCLATNCDATDQSSKLCRLPLICQS